MFYLSVYVEWVVVAVLQCLAVVNKLIVHLSCLFTVQFPFQATKFQFFHLLNVQHNPKQIL